MKWFFGRQPALEILRSGKKTVKLLISENASESELKEILSLAREKTVSVQRVPVRSLDSLTAGAHQGVAVQVSSELALDFKTCIRNLPAEEKIFVSLLDEIQDPGNLGAILRSALCFGCSAVFLSKWRSSPLTDTVMKSSSGAAAHLSLAQCPNLSPVIERLKEKGFTIYGADPAGSPISSVELQFPLAILLGNEHRGVKPVLKKSCDGLISIPQKMTVASLNVSNAAAVIFYEISRRSNSFTSLTPFKGQ